MNREQRSIAIVVLIIFVYGFSLWLQSGIFIPPTPLFPLFSLVVGSYICFLNYKADRYISIFIAAFLLIEFLFSPFFLMFVFTEEKFIHFTNSAWPELVKLISFLLWFTSGILLLLKVKSVLSKGIIALFLVGFISSITFNSTGLYCFSLLPLLLFYRKDHVIHFPLHYIAFLLLVLRSVEWIFLRFAV